MFSVLPSIGSTTKGSRFGRLASAKSKPALSAFVFSSIAFCFFPGEHAVVDHVAHEAAQLGVVGDRGDQLVERDRIENEVAAQLVQLQRLVVDHRGARRQRQHILFRRLGVQRDEEVDLLLAGDVALGAGAHRVPRRQARDVRGEHVLAGDGHAHLEDGAQEHEVGGLAPGSVDGGDLNREIVDDALGTGPGAGFLLDGRGH
jgi:hypothetical protein